MEPERLLSATLRQHDWGAGVAHILAAALAAVEPAAAVQRHVQRAGDMLHIDGRTYDLRQYEQVFLVGAGKAAAAMARAAADVLGPRLTAGLVIVKDEGTPPAASDALHPRLTLTPASHPLPDERGIHATQQVADLLAAASERDLVLCLISGGGSALLTLPAPQITLADLQHLTDLLLGVGATIHEINCLRKHIDLVKGGGLARMAAPATLVTLILSDVVGNPLDVIASGPTVPDTSSYDEALRVIEQYHLSTQAPATIIEWLRQGQQGTHPETPAADDPIFARVHNVLIGSNRQAALAAVQQASREGWHARILTSALQGEARVVGQMLAALAHELAQDMPAVGGLMPLLPRPACLVAGGETTVTLRGSGHGGRNQELALAAVTDLAALADYPCEAALVTLATDGGDGPTDAAGAIATTNTLQRAQNLGLDPAEALAQNNAYPFFAALDDLLRPGPTGTNVNDLALVLVWERAQP